MARALHCGEVPEVEAGGRPAVVLLSGGLDSATALALARRQGFVCHALSFDYGQRHRVELAAAARVAAQLGAATFRRAWIDQRAFGAAAGSALTDDIEVPKDRDPCRAEAGVPLTYVPARNTIFLAHALALAEVLGSGDIFIGVNAVDYSGYPDCRPCYVAAFERMANLATRAALEGQRLRIHAPLIHWPKTRIIRCGLELGVDYGLTHSCYDPDPAGRPCRRCDSCRLRIGAFEALGMIDPALASGPPS
jgi:7-cyano-7-deazaguanine synthase